MLIKVDQLKRPRIRPYAFKIKRPHLPFGSLSKDKEMLKVIEWLILNIGTIETDRWELRGLNPSLTNVYFSDEKDAAAFKLRWM